MNCFYCKNDIKDAEEKFMLAIEVPYVNLWFHRSCYNLNIKPQENLYLAQNAQMIYFYKDERSGKNKNGSISNKK
jgi:hypothetical protein